MIDIVLPEGNEQAFVEMAQKLGIDELVFLYPTTAKVPDVSSETVKTHTARLEKGKKCLVVAKAQKKARHFLESRQCDLVYGMEDHKEKDFVHHRKSYFNQVLAKIAHDKGKMVGFDFSSVLNGTPLQRARLLGRMAQNAKLCRKYDVKVVVASFAPSPMEMRAPAEMKAFASQLGMSTEQQKSCLTALADRLREKDL